MGNIADKISKLSEENRIQFYNLVRDSIEDTGWLREQGIDISNPDLMAVQEILYNQMYVY